MVLAKQKAEKVLYKKLINEELSKNGININDKEYDLFLSKALK